MCTSDAESGSTRLERAKARIAEGRYSEAAELLLSGPLEGPAGVPAARLLHRGLALAGRHDEAVALADGLDPAIHADREDRLASALHGAGRHAEVIELLLGRDLSGPARRDGARVLHGSLMAEGRHDEAAALAEGLDPSVHTDRRERWARALHAAGRDDEVIALLAGGQPMGEAGRAEARLLRASLVNRGRHDEAIALTASLDPSVHPDRDASLGRLLYEAGRYEAAVEALRRSVKRESDPLAHVSLVRALRRAGRPTAALAYARRVGRRTGLDPIVRARMLNSVGLSSRAVALLREATFAARATNEPTAWEALVALQMDRREWGEAWASLELAGARGTESRALRAHRERVEAALRATGVRLELDANGRPTTVFRSTEAVVRALVDRVLVMPRAERERKGATVRPHVVLAIGSLGAGGAERQVVNLANALVDCGRVRRVTLLCESPLDGPDGFYRDQLDSRVVVDRYYDPTRSLSEADVPAAAPFADLLEHVQPESRRQRILQLAVRLERDRPDAVEGWMDETFIVTALACAVLRREVDVISCWVNVPPGVKRTLSETERSDADCQNVVYREIARLPWLRYSSNSALNGAAYAKLLGIEPEAVTTIHNGIDESALTRDAPGASAVRAELGIPKGVPVVGSVMRLVNQKRPLLWIDAAARIAERRPEAHFVILGAGPMASAARERATARGLERVHFASDRSDVGAWLEAFDVFLLTSEIEGVPNAVVEAQLSRCPVVAQNVGGMSEIVVHGRSGLLLEDASEVAIAEAVLEVLGSPELSKRLSGTALRDARDRHSPRSMAEGHLRLLLRERPPSIAKTV